MTEMQVDWDAVRADAAATLSRYIQFDTTNPPGNEMPAAEWLRDQLIGRGIMRDVTLHEPAAGRGLVLARIPGSEPLKPLLLNHHMDVVAADPAQWTHPPFSGAVADGFVWGRGTLDTKNLGVVTMLALGLLIKEGVRFRRPVIFLAVPDEETGGSVGMQLAGRAPPGGAGPGVGVGRGERRPQGDLRRADHVRRGGGRETDPTSQARRDRRPRPRLHAACQQRRRHARSRRWSASCATGGRCG